MAEGVQLMGGLLALVGLGLEFASALAMASYFVRKRLPSPFTLQATGCMLFYLGVVVLGVGRVAE